MLKERYGHPTDAESLKSFATLAAYRDGGIFATHFRGSSGWERHPHGDEVVQILEGATRFDILVDEVMQSLELSAGMLVVVPKGCWHRFASESGVKVLTTELMWITLPPSGPMSFTASWVVSRRPSTFKS